MQTMLHQPRTSIQATTTPLAPQIEGGTDWRTAAIAVYRRSVQTELTALPQELVARIHELTGHAVALTEIWIDHEAGTATVAVDGVLFRLRQGTLMLIQPCATSRTGYVESAPIGQRSDLGRVLLAWEAACDDASAEDGDDGSHSW